MCQVSTPKTCFKVWCFSLIMHQKCMHLFMFWRGIKLPQKAAYVSTSENCSIFVARYQELNEKLENVTIKHEK